MSDTRIRHPKNAPGPFYVEQGCCTACMAPHAEAPDLMGFDVEEGHCYIRQQPSDKGATYRAIRALWSSELGCLRYAGDDPDILRRLVEAGLAYNCDKSLPLRAKPLLRNHVTFTIEQEAIETEMRSLPTLRLIASRLSTYIEQKNTQYQRYTLTPLQHENTALTFALDWGYDAHEIHITDGEPNTGRRLVAHSPSPQQGSSAVSLMLDDWLRGDTRLQAIRWYTAEAWEESRAEWQETCI